MKKIKKWDKAVVISGKNKGKVSTVNKIEVKKHKLTGMENEYVYLDWVNLGKKAVKKEGFKEITLPIHISNIQLFDEESKRWYRVWVKLDWNKKTRILKKINKEVR